MVGPRQMAEYVGFTETEGKTICKEYDMSFKEMQRWYEGDCFEKIGHVYSPNCVSQFLKSIKEIFCLLELTMKRKVKHQCKIEKLEI